MVFKQRLLFALNIYCHALAVGITEPKQLLLRILAKFQYISKS
jgi:hypothetical protein